MGLEFKPVITKDGSIGLFSSSIDDIYHSSYGAYNEALEKFILPSGILDSINNGKEIRVLDICYGMGYNTRTLINKCLKIDSSACVFIDALEIDPYVAAFSFLDNNTCFDFELVDYIDFLSPSNNRLVDSIFDILDSAELDEFLSSEKTSFWNNIKITADKYNNDELKNSVLHNIYYENISCRNIKTSLEQPKRPDIRLSIHLNDARKSISQLKGDYDFVFLDAFTPTKLPTLWTVEFFKEIYSLLNDDGNITTYSNSAAIRNGFIEAGFAIGKTELGTIAYKNKNLINTPLDEKSQGLLNTKAGIPFYDKNLNSTKDEILSLREKMVSESEKQSSSQYLKNYTNNKLGL